MASVRTLIVTKSKAVVSWLRGHAGLSAGLALILLFGCLLIILGSFLENSAKWAAHFLMEFGIACVISFFLAVIIKVAVSRRIAAGSLDAILKVIIPADVWAEIRENIIKQTAIREDYQLSMVLDSVPRSDGLYISTTRLAYGLQSLRDLQVYAVEHDLEPHLTGEEDGQPLPRFK